MSSQLKDICHAARQHRHSRWPRRPGQARRPARHAIALTMGALAGATINQLPVTVRVTDMRTPVASAALFAAGALAASFLPARRAARIDPLVALRQD